ncbi:MAG: hypothetical protein JWO86_9024 [Myxococcaceae bacterium]|nr:hypothetical protein [Myxococcaceae bacterium]
MGWHGQIEARHLTLVTANTKHFAHDEGLTADDWSR